MDRQGFCKFGGVIKDRRTNRCIAKTQKERKKEKKNN